MDVSLDEFVQQLVDSGILAGDTMNDVHRLKSSVNGADELIRELVRQKKLTTFQAQELSRGNGKSLVLGNYVLLEKIGAGGMGEVYKAEHRRMHRFVAVKVLPAATMSDPATVARFEREVTAAARISHPNIVTALDADCAGGIHFLVMELVEGSDLKRLVQKNGPFPVKHALNYVIQAATGLEAAHAAGIVHRDIKPSNLLRDHKGIVKILDMGLARLEAKGKIESTQYDLTGSGMVGTVDYMSPEQAFNSKQADGRADIYGLGCTLYYLITGKAIYSGETILEKILAHRERPIPSLKDADNTISDQLQAAFQKMVAKKVEDRYQTVTALIADLQKRCDADETTSHVSSESTEDDRPARVSDFASGSAGLVSAPGKPIPVKDVRKFHRLFWLFAAGIVVVAIVPRLMMNWISEGPDSANLSPQKGTSAGIGTKAATNAATGSKGHFFFQTPEFDRWVQDVGGMSGDAQVQAVTEKLKELNPEFDGTARPVMEGGVVQGFDIFTDHITDISPVRAFSGLKSLWCSAMGPGAQDCLSDLSPLKGLPLTFLVFNYTRVSDLSPLQGMKLTHLTFDGANVTDLSPLSDMPLQELYMSRNPVTSLSPLKKMKLLRLFIDEVPVTDLSPLKGMPLIMLSIHGIKTNELSLLQSMPIHHLCLDFNPKRDTGLLRSMKDLETINQKPKAESWTDVE